MMIERFASVHGATNSSRHYCMSAHTDASNKDFALENPPEHREQERYVPSQQHVSRTSCDEFGSARRASVGGPRTRCITAHELSRIGALGRAEYSSDDGGRFDHHSTTHHRHMLDIRWERSIYQRDWHTAADQSADSVRFAASRRTRYRNRSPRIKLNRSSIASIPA